MKNRFLSKVIATVLVCVLMVSTFALTPINVSAAQNIALGMQAFASHEENSSTLAAKNLTDGNGATRWSGWMEPNSDNYRWVYIDLGSRFDITAAEIIWENAYATKYDVQVSDDGKTFTTIYSGDGKAGSQYIDLEGTGRFIRIYMSEFLMPYGCSIYDFKVYGNKCADQVVSSITYEAENATFDGDIVIENDANASGGKVAGNTSGRGLIFYNVPESNHVSITYTSYNGAGQFKVYRLVDGSYQYMHYADFGATGSWTMEKGKTVKSYAMYMPAGSTIKIVPSDFANIDCVSFSNELYARHEFEHAHALNADSTVESDADASGGRVVGNTINKEFVFYNTPEANRVSVSYATTHTTAVVNIYLLKNGAYQKIGAIGCPSSGAWTMGTGRAGHSEVLYIPGGSTIKIVATDHVNLDYMAFYSDAESKFEAENYYSGSIGYSSYASAGAYAQNTKNNEFIFTDVPRSNKLQICYVSTYSSTIDVYLLNGGAYEHIGNVNFSTTTYWDMAYTKTLYSDAMYIPGGATIKLVPRENLNLDYVVFIQGPVKSEDQLDSDMILAKNSERSDTVVLTEDLMSSMGVVAHLTTKDQYVKFKIPEGSYNTYSIKYRTEGSTSVSLDFGTRTEAKTLGATKKYYYGPFGQMHVDLSGGYVTVTMAANGSLFLDSITFSDAVVLSPKPDITLPAATERVTVSLDGVWECIPGGGVGNPAATSVPAFYNNLIPVPGLWDMAAIDMGDYKNNTIWYKREIEMPADFNSSYKVTLEILRAMYGRSIYINGQFVETYHYNFTYSHTDISRYLKPGYNKIEILVNNLDTQVNDPNCPAHVIVDCEKSEFLQGIYDSVNLIINREPVVTSAQTLANLYNPSITSRVKVANGSGSAITTDVTLEIYELGVFEDGVPNQERRLVNTWVKPSVTIPAYGSVQIDTDAIHMYYFEKETKAWTPENPYLYELVVKTSGDTFSDRFAMRTFYFDDATNLPYLNGDVYYLRGTNLAMFRFFEDDDREDHPWDEEWIRTVYSEMKYVNWEAFRFHVGTAPEIWYDLADELGFMIFDEYAWWGCFCGCTVDTMLPELRAWIDERQMHPSIINWDMCNECLNDQTWRFVSAIKSERYDIDGNRTWDNGYNLVPDGVSTVESHPYPFIDAYWKFSKFNDYVDYFQGFYPWLNMGDNTYTGNNPVILNEYGWLWLDRYGEPTGITENVYNKNLMPLGTNEQRMDLYGYSLSRLTEFYRASRHFVGILQFCCLAYSKPNQMAVTGDMLHYDLDNPQINPYYKEHLRSSFARLGIVINNYTENAKPGSRLTVPVTLINDYTRDLNDIEVEFKILNSNDEVIHTQTLNYDLLKKAGQSGDLVTKYVTYLLPDTDLVNYGDEIKVIAEYTYDGQTIRSLRKIKMDIDKSVSIPQGKYPAASSYAQYDDGTDWHFPSYATDGNLNTRWGTDYKNGDTSNSYLTVYLGYVHDISNIKIVWEAAYAKSYEIQVSNDNVTYKTVYTNNNCAGGTENLTFENVEAKWVRIKLNTPATNFGFSIWEFQVFGDFVILEGDASGDGVLDAIDLATMRRKLVGVPTIVRQKTIDANGDGIVDVRDLVRIKRKLAGLI